MSDSNKDLLEGVVNFEASALKHVEKVPEKAVLPSQEGIIFFNYIRRSVILLRLTHIE
jgi:hypothetical protein